MKKVQTGQSSKTNAKISDYFSRVQSVANDNKRKFSESLETITNVPKSKRNVSPQCKKVKHDENCKPPDHCQRCEDCGINNGSSFKVVTPKKCLKPSSSMRTPSSTKKSDTNKDKTPQKRGTPSKRLFEKSPKRLEEFNVQVMEDFVKISPSTSNIIVTKNTPKKSSDLEPKRTPSKIRTKLNFLPMATLSPNQPDQRKNNLNGDLETGLEDIFNDQFDIAMGDLNELNFNEPKHCKILEVRTCSAKIVLKLKSKNGNVALCNIEEFWASSGHFEVGNEVYVSAKRNAIGEWIVNNNFGWVVYKPDVLASCTSVVGSLFCQRKTVLSERFRGLDWGNRFMVIGALVHTLLEQALAQKLKHANEIEMLLKNMLKSTSTAKKLYENNLSYDEVESELLPYVPHIQNFIDEYMNKDARRSLHNLENWTGKIDSIADIEENLWCPDLGLKGKIDVTIKTESALLPLEIKSGRASVSFEHRGQIILYIMMMNKFGYKVSSGLLFYLREGVLKEIKATPQEKRDLIVLRNELVYYLTRGLNKSPGEPTWRLPELPQPLFNNRACSKCPYNVVCTAYLKYDECDLSKNKTLQEVQNDVIPHLTKTHLNYFIHWNTLLSLEAECNTNCKSIQDIYTVKPTIREFRGRCIINLKVVSVMPESNGLFEHTLKKDISNDAINLATFGITENNYVVLSTENRPAVASGFVTGITSFTIKIALDRNLNRKYQGKLFHVDTYDSNVTQTFNMSSLALLLEATPRAAELRDIIIDKKAPTFISKLPSVIAKKGVPIMRRLNRVQQKAVLKALCAEQFILIKGMPGTGKSATIVALIQLLVELNKTVLITSHTHSAIDNICIRLQKFGVDFIRLGSESKIDADLKSKSEASLIKGCTTPEQLTEIYNSFKVIAVTCLGSAHPLLSKRSVDYCIVDESTQVLQTSVIKPLYAAKKFVLIGDPDQLAPLVRSREALSAGMSESLFERLNNSEGTVTLNLNYRMNQTITNLANVLTYKGELQAATEDVANRTLHIPDVEAIRTSYVDQSWLLTALETSLEASVQFIDTGPVWKLPNIAQLSTNDAVVEDNTDLENCINVYESSIVETLVKALLKGGVTSDDIGVIATYRAQVVQLSTLLQDLISDVSTIDQFQGRDKNLIIYSCTKSIDPSKTSAKRQKFELLEDKRRLTVAITRAKRKLIIVGDVSTLQNYNPFSVILSALKKNIVKFNSPWTV